MSRLEITTVLQSVREYVAPQIQDVFRGLPEDVKTTIETGIEAVLTLARPLFGPNEVAEGFSLFPEPVMNVNDTASETASVFIPDEPYLFSLGLLDLGGPFGPPSEFFGQAVNLNFDRDADDDDAEQVLKEIIDGDGGAVFDFEREPGIDGVTLLSITPNAYTLSFENSDALDVLTLQGPGIAAVIRKLDAPANVADRFNNLSLVDLSEETVAVGSGAANLIPEVAEEQIATEGQLAALLNAALDPRHESVSFLSVAPDSFAVRVSNAAMDASDTLIFDGLPAANAVATAASSFVDPSNGISEFTFADVTGTGVVAVGNDLDLYFGGPEVGSVGEAVTEADLLDILSTAHERPFVNALDQGDTVRLDVLGANDSRDMIIFATDQPVPGGAFDLALFA
jgi:hypothetical protein